MVTRSGPWLGFVLTGRTRMIRQIIDEYGPISAAGVRRIMIDKNGCNWYTDMTASEIRAHMKKHMKGETTIYDKEHSIRYVLTEIVPK